VTSLNTTSLAVVAESAPKIIEAMGVVFKDERIKNDIEMK
jgi:hypothetical protein